MGNSEKDRDGAAAAGIRTFAWANEFFSSFGSCSVRVYSVAPHDDAPATGAVVGDLHYWGRCAQHPSRAGFGPSATFRASGRPGQGPRDTGRAKQAEEREEKRGADEIAGQLHESLPIASEVRRSTAPLGSIRDLIFGLVVMPEP